MSSPRHTGQHAGPARGAARGGRFDPVSADYVATLHRYGARLRPLDSILRAVERCYRPGDAPRSSRGIGRSSSEQSAAPRARGGARDAAGCSRARSRAVSAAAAPTLPLVREVRRRRRVHRVDVTWRNVSPERVRLDVDEERSVTECLGSVHDAARLPGSEVPRTDRERWRWNRRDVGGIDVVSRLLVEFLVDNRNDALCR